MLVAQNVRLKGRHHDLVPPLSLEAATGELLLAVGDDQDQRTALALALSARMRPDEGTVSWGQSAQLKHLRKHSALIDSPGVNEPEPHLSVKDLVAEDLALVPRRYRGIREPAAWLKVNSLGDIARDFVDSVPVTRRLELLCTLALANPEVDVLILDSPDRFSQHDDDWLPYLQALAQDAGRPLCIVATVSHVPEGWAGPLLQIPHPLELQSEAEPESDLESGPELEPEVTEEPDEDPEESQDTK
ncbi:ABC transporter ATP-binding protein [Psychromicrobium xiongbiense]|uniref:ABC transporter ATP-binding protein n=1 Tax=Psychromicrobium xiongbiense TaxID=3051184 RepID=UPI0025521410|nr:ABC transporter ATP-binding protein [Psychromicrobium sp. YIM S02556]